ncbi:MAG: hypothetical protein N7Q72_07070 [Spiroplasma sp. Tabriz.8]|nr:hypothetical protein [Spiroplasma sp. Tabriz.8]
MFFFKLVMMALFIYLFIYLFFRKNILIRFMTTKVNNKFLSFM